MRVLNIEDDWRMRSEEWRMGRKSNIGLRPPRRSPEVAHERQLKGPPSSRQRFGVRRCSAALERWAQAGDRPGTDTAAQQVDGLEHVATVFGRAVSWQNEPGCERRRDEARDSRQQGIVRVGDRATGEVEIEMHCGYRGLSNEGRSLREAGLKRTLFRTCSVVEAAVPAAFPRSDRRLAQPPTPA